MADSRAVLYRKTCDGFDILHEQFEADFTVFHLITNCWNELKSFECFYSDDFKQKKHADGQESLGAKISTGTLMT